MLISEAYRQQNLALHVKRSDYGASAQRWAEPVAALITGAKPGSVLDYGCGKQTLRPAVKKLVPVDGIDWRGYDPAIPTLDAVPEPADLVVCTDVLEHIEPECLEAVLDDLYRCTLQVAFLVVATRPAQKFLPDGRNAHLIVEPYTWWLPKIWQRWVLTEFQRSGGEFVVVGKKTS